MQQRLAQLEEQIHLLQERNRRVDAEKAWETSGTRMSLILAVTYVVATLLLWLLGAPAPYLSALVPTCGYALSTLTLPAIKRRWMARFGRRH